MENGSRRPQAVTRFFVWFIVILLLFIGWWVTLNQESGELNGVGETAVSPTNNNIEPSSPSFAPKSNVDLPIINDLGLIPAPIPYTFEGKTPQHQFQTYIVQRGDTPNGIADRFSINAETILGGNPQLSQESSLLQTDVELIILPVNGVLHTVQPGDTLEGISFKYGIPTEEIIAYVQNNLEFPYRLESETQIIVPGAVRELFVWTPPDLSSVSSSSSIGGVTPVIVGTGTFIFPVNSRNYTQYYWYGHRGVDIALAEGSTVTAADTGTVTYASWNNWGFGNLIVVNHGNGFETFYAHLSGINVVPGQIVYQGNAIGTTGNTGNSSGPHIHFEIRTNGNQDDPCWYLGC